MGTITTIQEFLEENEELVSKIEQSGRTHFGPGSLLEGCRIPTRKDAEEAARRWTRLECAAQADLKQIIGPDAPERV